MLYSGPADLITFLYLYFVHLKQTQLLHVKIVALHERVKLFGPFSLRPGQLRQTHGRYFVVRCNEICLDLYGNLSILQISQYVLRHLYLLKLVLIVGLRWRFLTTYALRLLLEYVVQTVFGSYFHYFDARFL